MIVPSEETFEFVDERAPSPDAALSLLMWAAWSAVMLVVGFFAFMMLKFADSPRVIGDAQIITLPLLVWYSVALVVGAGLLLWRGTWQVITAFALAISPPFVIVIGFKFFTEAGPIL